MTRLCAAALIVSLGWPSMAAAGPLQASLAREAVRLGQATAVDSPRPSWRRVRELDSRTRLVVTMADGTTISGSFVSLEDSTLVVERGGAPQRLPRNEVVTIDSLVRRGSAAAAVLGTLGGIWLGSGMAFALGESRCYQHCGGVEIGMFSLAIGVPIAAGYGAWRGTSHMTEEVIYRAAARP